MEKSPVDPSQVLLACRALVAHCEKQKHEKEKSSLIVEDETVLVVMALQKIPDKLHRSPIPIPLVHPFMEKMKVCFFAKGKERCETSSW